MSGGTPSFDPDEPQEAESTFNRATQGLYPPGSTMKTVTATSSNESSECPGRPRRPVAAVTSDLLSSVRSRGALRSSL